MFFKHVYVGNRTNDRTNRSVDIASADRLYAERPATLCMQQQATVNRFARNHVSNATKWATRVLCNFTDQSGELTGTHIPKFTFAITQLNESIDLPHDSRVMRNKEVSSCLVMHSEQKYTG